MIKDRAIAVVKRIQNYWREIAVAILFLSLYYPIMDAKEDASRAAYYASEAAKYAEDAADSAEYCEYLSYR